MIGLDPSQLRRFVIEPALMMLGHTISPSRAAIQLVLGTAIVESDLRFIDQNDAANKPGPAYGLWQIERLTFDDHFRRSAQLLKNELCGGADGERPDASALHWNLRLGAMMCRIIYWHAPEALPVVGDAHGMATLWKKRYNTFLGAGTIEKAEPGFKLACSTI